MYVGDVADDECATACVRSMSWLFVTLFLLSLLYCVLYLDAC